MQWVLVGSVRLKLDNEICDTIQLEKVSLSFQCAKESNDFDLGSVVLCNFFQICSFIVYMIFYKTEVLREEKISL